MGYRRRLVVGVGLSAYWSAVGYEITAARLATPELDVLNEWYCPATLTLPWSLAANQVGEGAPRRTVRVAYTLATTAGGLLNGLLFAGLVLSVRRPARPVPDTVGDYADAPDGATRDGRIEPPA